MPGRPAVWPTKVEVKISEPPPRASRAGIWCLAPRKALVRLVAMASCQACSERSGRAQGSPVMPALLKAMSRPPKRSVARSEEHTSELQSQSNLVCRLLLEKKKKKNMRTDRLETLY